MLLPIIYTYIYYFWVMEFNILRLDDSSDSMTNYTMIYYCWVVEFYITLHCTLKLDDSRSNSMTIIIISVTIMTVIHVVKNYYHDTGHVVIGMCIGHCLVSTCPQPCDMRRWRGIFQMKLILIMSWKFFCWRALRVVYRST